jgi:hypothetical protein
VARSVLSALGAGGNAAERARDESDFTQRGEFERLQQLWRERKVEIANVIFRFCGEHPPLSWHLTRREKDAIEAEWQAYTAAGRQELRAVQAFLRGQPLPVIENGKPYDVPMTPCP